MVNDEQAVGFLERVKGPAAKAAVFGLCDIIGPTLLGSTDPRVAALGAALGAACQILRKKGKK